MHHKTKGKRRKKRISMVEYVSVNNTPQAAQMIVTKFGMSPAKNLADLQKKMWYAIKQFGDEALDEFKKIHPDNIMFEDESAIGHYGENSEYSYQSACGCNHPQDEKEYNNIVTNYRSDVEFQAVAGEGDEESERKLMIRGALALAGIGLLITILSTE